MNGHGSTEDQPSTWFRELHSVWREAFRAQPRELLTAKFVQEFASADIRASTPEKECVIPNSISSKNLEKFSHSNLRTTNLCLTLSVRLLPLLNVSSNPETDLSDPYASSELATSENVDVEDIVGFIIDSSWNDVLKRLFCCVVWQQLISLTSDNYFLRRSLED